METNIKHIIMFSGGASSAYVAKWVVDKYGKENCILLFTDTQVEDEDNRRFMEDVANYLEMEITIRVDGRTPEDVFFEQKFLGNARHAKCSHELKVKQTIIFLYELIKEGIHPILYFGISAEEEHRIISITHNYGDDFDLDVTNDDGEIVEMKQLGLRFPLGSMIRTSEDIHTIIEREWSIPLPRMYKLGFKHANCGGKCVRAGKHHFANLYMIWPDRFAEFEDMEERFRNKYNLNVSMMKSNGGPYTLKQFREEVLVKMTPEELNKYAHEDDVDYIPCACSFS